MANAAVLKTASPDAAPPVPAGLPSFRYAMLTHPGRVRRANQDACAAAPEHAAFVVCDGVGGAAGGEIASQLAVESFLNAVRQSSAQNGVAHSSHDGNRAMSGEEDASSSPHSRLHQAVLAANAAVLQRAQRQRHLRGMATTLVAALLQYRESDRVAHSRATTGAPSERSLLAGVAERVSGDEDSSHAMSGVESCPTLWLAHAGDSRAYRLRRAAHGEPAHLTQLTADHSLVEEQVRAGILRPSEALRSPVRNVITRAVGAAPAVEPEIASHEIQPGDLYLLASDGLTRELNDAAIARILSEALGLDRTTTPEHSSAALEAATQALIDAANQHGGRDNITVLLLACR